MLRASDIHRVALLMIAKYHAEAARRAEKREADLMQDEPRAASSWKRVADAIRTIEAGEP